MMAADPVGVEALSAASLPDVAARCCLSMSRWTCCARRGVRRGGDRAGYEDRRGARARLAGRARAGPGRARRGRSSPPDGLLELAGQTGSPSWSVPPAGHHRSAVESALGSASALVLLDEAQLLGIEQVATAVEELAEDAVLAARWTRRCPSRSCPAPSRSTSPATACARCCSRRVRPAGLGDRQRGSGGRRRMYPGATPDRAVVEVVVDSPEAAVRRLLQLVSDSIPRTFDVAADQVLLVPHPGGDRPDRRRRVVRDARPGPTQPARCPRARARLGHCGARRCPPDLALPELYAACVRPRHVSLVLPAGVSLAEAAVREEPPRRTRLPGCSPWPRTPEHPDRTAVPASRCVAPGRATGGRGSTGGWAGHVGQRGTRVAEGAPMQPRPAGPWVTMERMAAAEQAGGSAGRSSARSGTSRADRLARDHRALRGDNERLGVPRSRCPAVRAGTRRAPPLSRPPSSALGWPGWALPRRPAQGLAAPPAPSCARPVPRDRSTRAPRPARPRLFTRRLHVPGGATGRLHDDTPSGGPNSRCKHR